MTDQSSRSQARLAELEADLARAREALHRMQDLRLSADADASRWHQLVEGLREQLAFHQRELEVARRMSDEARASLEPVRQQLTLFTDIDPDPASLGRRLAGLERALSNADHELIAMRRSWSWRLTAALRWVSGFTRR